MSEKDLADIEDLEIEPLTDSEIESASGGNDDNTTTTCPWTSWCQTTVRCPPAEVE